MVFDTYRENSDVQRNFYQHGLITYNNCLKCLTNRFHVAVHLSFNRSQMTSKCGKNKKVAHEVIAECVTDVLTTF